MIFFKYFTAISCIIICTLILYKIKINLKLIKYEYQNEYEKFNLYCEKKENNKTLHYFSDIKKSGDKILFPDLNELKKIKKFAINDNDIHCNFMAYYNSYYIYLKERVKFLITVIYLLLFITSAIIILLNFNVISNLTILEIIIGLLFFGLYLVLSYFIIVKFILNRKFYN